MRFSLISLENKPDYLKTVSEKIGCHTNIVFRIAVYA
jgi:hypothetical protein